MHNMLRYCSNSRCAENPLAQEDDSLSPIEAANRRLMLALDNLESNLQRCLDAGVEAERLKGDIQTLSYDRSRLAAALDKAQAKNAELVEVQADVEKRIDQAMGMIESVVNDS